MNSQTPTGHTTDAVETLARIIRPWTVCDDGGAFDHGSTRAATAVLDAGYVLAARGNNTAQEQAIAEAEIRGQMRHITAEMIRGDQSLGEQEDLIADLRARLSHTEAERDDIRRQANDLADEWVAAEQAADDYGPRHAFTGYDCAEMLRAALSPAPTNKEQGGNTDNGLRARIEQIASDCSLRAGRLESDFEGPRAESRAKAYRKIGRDLGAALDDPDQTPVLKPAATEEWE